MFDDPCYGHDSNGNGCETGDAQLAYYGYFGNGTGAGKVGQLAEIRWSSSATNDRETFDYDTLGRLTIHTRIVTNRSYTMSYSNFDAFHRPTTITYPNGQTVTIGYDREGENSLANSGVSLISDVRYNGRGQMTFLGRATGGINTTYLYHPQNDVAGGGTGDSNFRLKTIQHGTPGTGNAWPDFTYEYDRVGNITKLTTLSTAGTDVQTFGYDHLNRLVSASASGVAPTYSDAYAYNPIGNITSFDGAAYTYSASHKHAVATANGIAYTYDNNGNMTLRDVSGTANDYGYIFNVENELTSLANSGRTLLFVDC